MYSFIDTSSSCTKKKWSAIMARNEGEELLVRTEGRRSEWKSEKRKGWIVIRW